MLDVGFASALHHCCVFLIKATLLPEAGITNGSDLGGKGWQAAFFVDAAVLGDSGLGLLEGEGVAATILQGETGVSLV